MGYEKNAAARVLKLRLDLPGRVATSPLLAPWIIREPDKEKT
jgi:hypothetical protein